MIATETEITSAGSALALPPTATAALTRLPAAPLLTPHLSAPGERTVATTVGGAALEVDMAPLIEGM